jgi:hypothetical protein
MRIYGRIIKLGGEPDRQNEFFTKDCKIKFQSSAQLPAVCVNAMHIPMGSVESFELKDGDLWGTVRIEKPYEEALRYARAVTPLLGLCCMGEVVRENREGGVVAIQEFIPTGVMIGVNVDISVGGFEFLNEYDALEITMDGVLPVRSRDEDPFEEKEAPRSLISTCDSDCEHCSTPCFPEATSDVKFEAAYDEAYATHPAEVKVEYAMPRESSQCDGLHCGEACEGCLGDPWVRDLERRLSEACGDRYSYDDVLKLLVCLNMGE